MKCRILIREVKSIRQKSIVSKGGGAFSCISGAKEILAIVYAN